MNSSYLVALLGARMHYAVPRILYAHGRLNRLHTDFYAGASWYRLLRLVPSQWRPRWINRSLGRAPADVPASKIRSYNRLGLKYVLGFRLARSAKDYRTHCLRIGESFCRSVLAGDWNGAGAVYTFNTAGLEILAAARRRGLFAVMEQTIAPYAIEHELMREERDAHPNWTDPEEEGFFSSDFADRERAEWEEADLILCGSDFVRDSIRLCGGPVDKCVVVPYGVDAVDNGGVPMQRVGTTGEAAGPLKVLTVGTVGLRKGSPYVIEAARQFGQRGHFRLIGPMDFASPQFRQTLPPNVEVLGARPRSEVAAHYAWADVFLLPSLCEGSATVAYEAMNAGLPVIATPNTGSVVRDGADGFIVPVRDAGAIVAKLEVLAGQPDLRRHMSEQARGQAQKFTVAEYGRRLIAALEGQRCC